MRRADSASLIASEDFDTLRNNLDDAGPAFLPALSAIATPDREQPPVCEGVADSAEPQDVFPRYSQVIGAQRPLVRSHASPTTDPHDSPLPWVPLHLEKHAYLRVGLDIARRKSPIRRAKPDTSLLAGKVQWSNARSPIAGQRGEARDHGSAEDGARHGIVSLHCVSPGASHNPRRPSCARSTRTTRDQGARPQEL